MTKHTPGPWATNPRDNALGAPKTDIVDARGDPLFATCLEFSPTLADARLIAAAPELLASLKEMLEVYGWDDGLGPLEILERAKAAIAKAEDQKT